MPRSLLIKAVWLDKDVSNKCKHCETKSEIHILNIKSSKSRDACRKTNALILRIHNEIIGFIDKNRNLVWFCNVDVWQIRPNLMLILNGIDLNLKLYYIYHWLHSINLLFRQLNFCELSSCRNPTMSNVSH